MVALENKAEREQDIQEKTEQPQPFLSLLASCSDEEPLFCFFCSCCKEMGKEKSTVLVAVHINTSKERERDIVENTIHSNVHMRQGNTGISGG